MTFYAWIAFSLSKGTLYGTDFITKILSINIYFHCWCGKCIQSVAVTC